jgi:hypothetical protein
MDTYQVLSSNSRLIRCLSLSNSHTNDCPTCLQLLAFRMYCLEREEEKETSNFFFFLFHHLAHEDYVVDSVLLFCCCFWDRISLCSPGQPWIKFSLDSVYCDYIGMTHQSWLRQVFLIRCKSRVIMSLLVTLVCMHIKMMKSGHYKYDPLSYTLDRNMDIFCSLCFLHFSYNFMNCWFIKIHLWPHLGL